MLMVIRLLMVRLIVVTKAQDKLASRFGTADAKPKPFDLKHPTKGEGHRLRYVY